MRTDKGRFRHESLQDSQSIQTIIKALGKGFAKKNLSFSDEDGEIVLSPDKLLHLKLTASKVDGRNRVTIRVTWQEQEQDGVGKGNKSLRVD